MKNNGFTIRPENSRRAYQVKIPDGRAKTAAVTVILAGLVLMAGASCEKPRQGVQAYSPEIYSKEDFQKLADEWFLTNLGIEMKHDVPLKITGKAGEISFTADGCNAEKKVSYEWTIYYDEYAPQLANADTNLSFAEMEKITNCRYGSNFILVVDSPLLKDFYSRLDYFYTQYTQNLSHK